MRNPTTARSTAMPVAAMRTVVACSSSSAWAGDGRALGRGRPGHPDGGDGRRRERHRGQADHPRSAQEPDLEDDHARHGRREPGQHRQHRQPGVGGDQLALVGDGGGHQGALGDHVGLGQHEHAERLGEQPQALEVARHREADQGPAGGRGDEHQPAPGRAAVEDGAEEGGHHRERAPW